MISAGRLPISMKNLRIFGTDADVDLDGLVASYSGGAHLVVLGFTLERLEEKGNGAFHPLPAL